MPEIDSQPRPSCSLSLNASKKCQDTLDHSGETEEEIRNQLLSAFKTCFHDVTEYQIHNYYFCKNSQCKDISLTDKDQMTDKHNRFKHKWILDPELAKCKDTGIWCLTYIDGKGMFCGLCRLTNTLQPSNKSKIWNCQANTRCRTSTVKEHFHSKKGEKTMHRDAIATQKSKRGTYFVQKEKEEEESSSTTNEKVFTSLYWLCKEEIAHSKLNSLLALVESLGVDDMS